MTERRLPGFAGMFQGPPDLAATAKDRVRGQGEYSESAIRADERRKVLDEIYQVLVDLDVRLPVIKGQALLSKLQEMRGTDD